MKGVKKEFEIFHPCFSIIFNGINLEKYYRVLFSITTIRNVFSKIIKSISVYVNNIALYICDNSMKYDKQLWKKYQDYIKENKFKVWNFFFSFNT